MKECEKIIEILYDHDQLISEMMKREKEMIMFSIREILHGNSSEYSFEIRKKALFDLLIIVREGYSLDIKERWGLFLSANHIMFVTPEYDDLIIEFRRSYNSLVKRIEDLVWGDADPAIRVGEREDVQENRSVVVISSQFLSEKHSQSQSVLEYACTISEGMGMPVMMINDAGTHCDTSWMRYN